MAYHVEGKDIVINGFESGIDSSIYSGVADMRNMEIITLPGEASVELAQIAATAPPVMNAVAFTGTASSDLITMSSTAGLYNGCALKIITYSGTGLTTNVVYYVFNLTSTTFQVRLAAANGSAINITADGTGTLTTYQYGNQRGIGDIAPTSYYIDRTGAINGVDCLLLVDASNYVWYMCFDNNSVPSNTLIFLGNIGGNGAGNISLSGIAIWNGYIILFGVVTSGEDYAKASTILTSGPAAIWNYGWQNMSTNSLHNRVDVMVSQEDGNLYWTANSGLGSIIEDPTSNFDPTDSTTYTITDSAILLPAGDRPTCIAELGSILLIGGLGTFVYVWDKLSLGFNSLLNIPDVGTFNIVATSQNAYVFSGNRGRIYITNGSGIDLYKKIPDYLTGVLTPYIVWWDANFSKNQLLFSFQAKSNAGTDQGTVAGVWAIDLDTDALRMQNKITHTGYSGIVSMVAPEPTNIGSTPPGVGIAVGWYVSSGNVYGVDVGSSSPYINYESFLQTELIPVGTYLDPFSPSQVEWKTSAPLVSGESVRLSYRPDINTAFAPIADASHLTGESSTVGSVSDYMQANFQKVQWVQLQAEIKSTATTPSFTRLTELRLRDWPSGKNNKK